MKTTVLAASLFGALLLPASLWAQEPASTDARDEAAVAEVLDELHLRASEAAFDHYFALFTDDAVFFGTDPDERWPIEGFRAYARPHFEAGRGWSYVPVERHVYIGPAGRTAWFDERLENANYGDTRGTGALVKGDDGRWRIAQYNLTIPVPNELARELVDRIREMERGG